VTRNASPLIIDHIVMKSRCLNHKTDDYTVQNTKANSENSVFTFQISIKQQQ